MNKGIHILGASGSGTTTLGKEISKTLGYYHLDTDDFYWKKTTPPFTQARPIKERQLLLKEAMDKHEKWVLTGSLVGWGDLFIPRFELVVFLWIPSDLRISRLHVRERERYGSHIDVGGPMHENYIKFIDWASHYDIGDITIRSKKLHDQWINDLSCEVLRIEGKYELKEKMTQINETLDKRFIKV